MGVKGLAIYLWQVKTCSAGMKMSTVTRPPGSERHTNADVK